jgi:hypothetical protein
MAVQIQLRRGTAAEWTAANPILAQGEMGVETDTGQFKVGNGVADWNTLGYGGLQGAPGTNGINLLGVTTQSGTSYSLQKTDVATIVSFTNSSLVTVTVPTETSASWVVGEGIVILQNGDGQVTVEGASGVTVNATTLSKTRTKFSTLSLIYLGSDTWIVIGDTAVL